MTYNIVALPGDGIGPEILNGSLSLLEIISNKYNFNYQIEHHEFGGASIDTFGEPLTEKTLNACKRADAILLGAIGGPKWTDPNNRPEQGIERIVNVAFKLAASRRGKLTSVDKENVLASSKLWRKVVNEVSQLYPEVTVNHLLVDACSMHLITNPKQFDVIVCENLFGDILSDEASVIPGSLGLSPSASFSNDGPRLYEPIHGSAPDIAGKNVANPFGMILSLAMCLRESLNQPDAADELEQHIYNMIEHGQTTADLGGKLNTTDIFEILSQKLNH